MRRRKVVALISASARSLPRKESIHSAVWTMPSETQEWACGPTSAAACSKVRDSPSAVQVPLPSGDCAACWYRGAAQEQAARTNQTVVEAELLIPLLRPFRRNPRRETATPAAGRPQLRLSAS